MDAPSLPTTRPRSYVMFIRSGLIPLTLVGSTPATFNREPVVRLDNANFTGSKNGSLTSFLGIPFAKPPIGSRRFSLSEPIDTYSGTFNVTSYGPSCSQQGSHFVPPEGLDPQVLQFLFLLGGGGQGFESEDCLTLNVIKSANAHPEARLPVVVWIYGGGFQTGSTSRPSPTGDLIVTRSIQLDEPIIYVSMNYRVSAFGSLVGKEAKDVGVANAGLHDQRQALRWVQRCVCAFGGDPNKVTTWGQSADALSVALQMLTNGGNTEGLFHGAFMESGGVHPSGDITLGQQDYDGLVRAAGCAGAEDTLECLRQAPFATLKAALDTSPVDLSYWGSVAKIPFVTGNCDEGTLFSLASLNVTTDAQFEEYIHDNYFPEVDSNEFQKVIDGYPSDVTQGSPYDTGTLNALSPQFKRIASIQGDCLFQGPRRLLLEYLVHKQNAWSYVSNKTKSLPDLGSAHGTDFIYDVYGGGPMLTVLINFVNHLDPDGKSGSQWPKYSLDNPKSFVFGPGTTSVQDDTYRKQAVSVMSAVLLRHPI